MPTQLPSLVRRFISSIALLVSLVAAVWLGLCAAASVVSPLTLKYLALFSITAPFVIVVNVLILLGWLFFARRKWRIVIPMLALFASYRIIPQIFGLHLFAATRQPDSLSARHLKVMSWNVHGMGIFEHTAAARANTDDGIIKVITKESPDILCLAEFYTTFNNVLKPYSTTLMQACGYTEFRFQYDNTLGTKVYLGTAIFSRYPIISYTMHSLHRRADGQDDVVLLQGDVALPGGDTMRLYFTHLQSFLLSDKEKTYLEEVKHRDEAVEMSRSKSFVRRFGEAYVKRAIQADTAAFIIADSHRPVLLCGDFNDLPGSYTYERMRGQKLRDAFTDAGFGLGRTYNLFSPTLRIDYILYEPTLFKLSAFRTIRTTLSDHNPVVGEFWVR